MARVSRDILDDFPPPPADARIAYGPEPLQFGDLRLPEEGGPHPLLVVIHGGYWKANHNLIHAGHLCLALADDGIATWNIEYRRLGDPGGGWPGTFDDVGLAVDFVPALQRQARLDVDRVVLFGHSAGGQLALWAARRIPLRGVVSVGGVVDLEVSWRRQGHGGPVERLLGGSPEHVPERYAAASPARLLPLGVPQVIVHGTADEIVPYDEGAYVEAAGREARLIALQDAGHFEAVDPQSREWPIVAEAIRSLLDAP